MNKKSRAVQAVLNALTGSRSLMDMARYVTDYANDVRYRTLHHKEGYVKGWCYEDRPFNWAGEPKQGQSGMLHTMGWRPTTTDEVPPSRLREPDSPYHLARIINNRFVTMLMGENRFPRFSIAKDRDTELWANQLVEQIEMQATFMEAATMGGAKGSVIVLFGIVDGEFQLECFNTKFCQIDWKNFNKGTMDAFTVSYPFIKQVFDEKNQKWDNKPFLFRRMVTAEFDVEFEPVELEVRSGSTYVLKYPNVAPKPKEDKTVIHDFGFVPARFIQNLPCYDSIDGDASAELAYDLIDRINENLAAINSATQGNLDPTLVLKMTPDDYRRLEEDGGPIKQGDTSHAVVVGEKGDAKYIEITCAGIEVALKIIERMREWALEVTDCIIADPHKLSGAAQSDSAISKLYAPMLSKLGLMRTQYGRALRGLISDMITAYHSKTATVMVDGVLTTHSFEGIEVLDPETQKTRTVAPKKGLRATDVKLTWGRFFEPSANDVFQYTEAAVMATGGKPVTTQKQAAQFLGPILGDPAIGATVVQLEADDVENKKLAAEAAKATPARPPSTAMRVKTKT